MTGLFSHILFGLTRWQNSLGLAQNRCVHCLRPFSPAAAAHGISQHQAAALVSVSANISSSISPATCLHPVADSQLCSSCAALLAPYTGPRCPRCGLPPSHPHEGNVVCGACLQNPPPWSSVAFHGLYQHALRHTLACRLVNSGGSIKEVADVLRHRSLNTSLIYAKTDRAGLVEVALPWPGSPA